MSRTVATIRASSISELLDCPLRWYAKHMLGKSIPARPPTVIGTATHRSTAVYDTETLMGHAVTATDTVSVAYDYIDNPDADVQWGNVAKSEAKRVAGHLHTRYVEQIAATRQFAAVELELSRMTVDLGDGVIIELTGTLDRVQLQDETRTGVADVKTGRQAVKPTGGARIGTHIGQLAVYDLLYEHTSGIKPAIAPEIFALSTSKDARVATTAIPQARGVLVGTEQYPGYLQLIAPYFKTGLFPPNPSSYLCSADYCPHFAECPYHG